MEPVRAETDASLHASPRRRWQAVVMLIATARDAAALLVPLCRSRPDGTLTAAHVDADARLIATATTEAAGDLAGAAAALVGDALRGGASGLIVARARGGGDPAPSAVDVAGARALAAAAASAGLRLHDHLIVAGDDCRSLRALGLL